MMEEQKRHLIFFFFSVIALIRKGSVDWKTYENLPGVGMRTFMKYEVGPFRNLRKTDR